MRSFSSTLQFRRSLPQITQIDSDQDIEGKASISIKCIERCLVEIVFDRCSCLRIIRACISCISWVTSDCRVMADESWNHAISGLTLAAMRTFEACLSTMALWIAVLVPPVFFFLTVQVVDNAMSRGELGVGGWMLLVALSQVLPLGALLWILFSAAAYTIAPGKLIVHRVASDREISLELIRKRLA